MTQQERFEADYLAKFPAFDGALAKYNGTTEYISDEPAFAYAVWLQQAKRHDAEIAELVEVLNLILPLAKGYTAVNDVGSNRHYCRVAEMAIAKYEAKK